MGAMDSEASGRRRRDALIVIGLLVVALVWRVVYVVEMQTSPYADHLTLDSEVYHETAIDAAHGEWPRAATFFQAPFYPWVLGLAYRVFGAEQATARWLQILMSVASCWLVYRIAERAFDSTVARVALGMSAFYGMYIYFANELLAVTLVVFLDLLGLDLLLRAAADGRVISWAAAGAVFGLSAITRPTILPCVAAGCLWALVISWRSGNRRAKLRGVVAFIAGVGVPIAPVTLHNYLADGDLVLIAANGGFNFYIGNNPQSDGMTAAAPSISPDRRDAQSAQLRVAREGLGKVDATPGEASHYWYDQGCSYIKGNPREALQKTVAKALILCNAHEVSNNRVIEFATRHSSIFSVATLGFWLVLPLALAGLVIGGVWNESKSLLLIFAVVYAATLVPFFVNARFRMPIVAVLLVFAAAAVVGWYRWLRARPVDRHSGRRMVASVIVAIVAAVVARPLPALKAPDAQAYFNEAEAYRAQGDYAAAAVWYQRALDAYPGYCDAAYNLARIHTDIFPDPRRVIAVLEPVLDDCTEDSGIRVLLGHALCAVGRCDEGGVYLQHAKERKPAPESE
jgi:4-amino-4-deoxy-L-arabinose transferase-like glycosyltransferase